MEKFFAVLRLRPNDTHHVEEFPFVYAAPLSGMMKSLIDKDQLGNLHLSTVDVPDMDHETLQWVYWYIMKRKGVSGIPVKNKRNKKRQDYFQNPFESEFEMILSALKNNDSIMFCKLKNAANYMDIPCLVDLMNRLSL